MQTDKVRLKYHLQILINVCFELLAAAQVGLPILMVSDKLSITERWTKLKGKPVLRSRTVCARGIRIKAVHQIANIMLHIKFPAGVGISIIAYRDVFRFNRRIVLYN